MRIKLFPEHAPKTISQLYCSIKRWLLWWSISVLLKTLWFKVETQLVLVWVASLSVGESFEDEFSEELYNVSRLSMKMLDQIQMVASSLSLQNQHLPYSKKEIARGGWPEPIAEIYAELR